MLTITTERDPQIDGTIVGLVGEASLAEMPQLERATLSLGASRPKVLIYDLSGLTFLASLAMGEMIRLTHAVREFGGRVAIAAPNEHVRGALVRARLERVIPIFDTVEQAVIGRGETAGQARVS